MSDLNVELATFKILMKDKQIEHSQDLLKEMRLLENPEKKSLVNFVRFAKFWQLTQHLVPQPSEPFPWREE